MPIIAPRVKLNNGLDIPVLGLGTYQSNNNEGERAVKHAIDAGYRHFDCAYVYGNEAEVGNALREKIKEGAVTREEIFVTSKLWFTYHEKELVVPTCKKSIKRLGLDYLDLYLIHWPFGYKDGRKSDVDYLEVWKGMEECVRLGLVKCIGVSNFNSEQIERLLANAEIKPVTNQVECHPLLNQKKLIEFCKSRDITVTAYCPLGKPISSPRKRALIENPMIIDIAKGHNKTTGQVILRYLIQNGAIPIPKSVTNERIEQNIDVFDFELTKEELSKIDELNTNERICTIANTEDHKYFPFHIEF